MKAPSYNDRAAQALATAAVIGTKAAAKRHGCSTRSIKRWRARCETDPSLAQAVTRARDLMVTQWQEQVPAALASAIDFIERAGHSDNIDDPEMVEAMSRAAERLSNVYLSMKWLDARLNPQTRAPGAQPLALVTGGRQQ